MTAEPGPAEVDRWLCDAADELHAYFQRRLRTGDAASAVLTETMRRAARHVREVPVDPERRRMWLYTIAANVLAEQHHATTRRHPGPEQAECDAEARETDAVKDALRLHTAQRELLMLIERSGLGIVEAARLLGLSAPTGGGSYAAAREHLRQSLIRAACH
ncbi:MAG TPA: sigma-70 family RNA polymerase sigma factor [Marmoricola sp.]|nr:sigma-70 family RNA polymerase sigma factor [Marmoricola sp.]